jgi:hypothetical protein
MHHPVIDAGIRRIGMIFNISRWTNKLTTLIQRVCSRKDAPCVGVSLVFFDPTAPPDEQWSYHIELAFDPDNPPNEKEREQLTKAFEFINAGVQRIMGEDVNDPELPNEFSARADFH